MNSQHRAIRTKFRSMSPDRAAEYIHAFHLPEEEELFLVECDVHRLSYIQAAKKYSTTPEVIKRRRHTAYAKIADEWNRWKEERRG